MIKLHKLCKVAQEICKSFEGVLQGISLSCRCTRLTSVLLMKTRCSWLTCVTRKVLLEQELLLHKAYKWVAEEHKICIAYMHS